MISDSPSWGTPGGRLTMRCVAAFWYTRVTRGGPRLLFRLAAVLAFVVLTTWMLPDHMSRAVFDTASNSALWPWKYAQAGDIEGGLRIVVFGESDFTMAERQDATDTSGDIGWTEALCRELSCSTYISLVPFKGKLKPSLSSNSLYNEALESVRETRHAAAGPGYDYTYLDRDYPTTWKEPDLAQQVQAFLSLPKPERPPKETLWVFNFGMWDVWRLASMPDDIAKEILDRVAPVVFGHVERLYDASTDPESVAFSDFRGYMEQAVAENATTRENADAAERRHTDAFRILVPVLLDPTLLPAWHTSRPLPGGPHSKAEQMRTAVELAALWNSKMQESILRWVQTPDPLTPEQQRQKEEEAAAKAAEKEAAKAVEKPAPPRLNARGLSSSEKRRGRRQQESALRLGPSADVKVAYPPERGWPQRDAIRYDLPLYLTERMVDGQLRNAGVKDANGVGGMPPSEGYLEVLRPCIELIGAGELPNGTLTETVEMIERGFKTGSFRLAQSSDGGTTSKEKRGLIGGLADMLHLGSSGPSEPSPSADDTTPAEEVEDEEDDVYEPPTDATHTICAAPHEHLFYTQFTLAQRAITDIARESAEMVRTNESIRADWARRKVSALSS